MSFQQLPVGDYSAERTILRRRRPAPPRPRLWDYFPPPPVTMRPRRAGRPRRARPAAHVRASQCRRGFYTLAKRARLYLLAGIASWALLTYSNLVSLFSLRLGLGQSGLVRQG